MDEFLRRMDPDALVPLVAIVAACVTVAILGLAKAWAKVRRTEMETALKQDMLNRGMAAADIKQVLEASAEKLQKTGCGSS